MPDRAPRSLPLEGLLARAPSPERESYEARALGAVFGDARAMATLSADGLPLADDAIRDRHRRWCARWEEDGFGPWLLWADDSEFLGYGGLQWTRVDDHEVVEVLYGIAPRHWRRGLASRIAVAAVGVAFEHVVLDELVCFTLASNAGSRKVMERAGFVFEREFERVGLPHVLYRLRRG